MASKAKAKAIVSVRRKRLAEQAKKGALEARESALESRLLATLTQHIPKDGKDGRDAPTLSDILAAIEIPAPINQTTTVVQEVNPTDMEEFIKGLLPEVDQSLQPKVEQITNTIDISDEKLEGFVSQEEFEKALRRIQDAITANQSSSGGGSRGDLVNVIQVTTDTTITTSQLLTDKYNVVLVMNAGITVTLPADNETKIIEVKQGFSGVGTYTINKA